MKAGRLDWELTLLRKDITTNSYGEEMVSWTECGVARAERVSLSGRRSEEVGEPFADYSVRWNIHDGFCVHEGWRCQDSEGYLFEIVAIEPNVRRGFKTLITQRVNE